MQYMFVVMKRRSEVWWCWIDGVEWIANMMLCVVLVLFQDVVDLLSKGETVIESMEQVRLERVGVC